MNTQSLFRQSIVAACLAGALSFQPVALRAQAEATGSASNPPAAGIIGKKFDLEISGGAMVYKGKRVSATVQTLASYLQDQDPGLNVVISPGIGDFVISDLKLHNADFSLLFRALEVATEGVVRASIGSQGRRGGGGGGPASETVTSLMFMRGGSRGDRQVEVFNLGGYLRRNDFGAGNEAAVNKSLQQLEDIILSTLDNLRQGESPKSWQPPRFVFHPGANLFIVIGSPEDIEVARKIVNALENPGGRGGRGGTQGGGFGVQRDPGANPPGAGLPVQPERGPAVGRAGGGAFGGGGGFGRGGGTGGRGDTGGFGGGFGAGGGRVGPGPAGNPLPAELPPGAATGAETNR